MDNNNVRKLCGKHEEFLTDNSWIIAILVVLVFGNKHNFQELDTILTKMENGTLTVEDVLKEETGIYKNKIPKE